MITPLAAVAQTIKNKGYKIKVKNGELRITRNGEVDDVKINCVYTKKEIDDMITGSGGSDNSYFKLKESDQLYLYKPSSIDQTEDHYVMSWNIDSDYYITSQTNFTFKDYLFGHTWSLTWNGNEWSGNNVVNLSLIKQSTYRNNNGKPGFIVQHTDYITKWLNCLEVVDPKANYATVLSKYVTNWRVAYRDGTIVDLTDSIIELSESPSYEIDGVKCDIQQFEVKVPNTVKSENMLYVLADINVDGYITPLKWDSHPTTPITSNYLQTWNDNPLIESFAYTRRVRFEPTNKKNIYIYIEKKYFEQMPSNASEAFNPFESIIVQQFYEVTPDPRNCTTLTTDHNIYSSKIIWADNIMTMRRDLNVVGGITDRLEYDYSLLKSLMDSFQEQMRLQAAYNEYTDSIRSGLQVATNILKVLTGAVQLASSLSELTVSSDNMTLNTYRTEDFHFPGFPGGGGPGGGGKDISGQFLLNLDTSAAGQVLRRFIPTQTTIPAATSTLTATSLVMNALNALTDIGDATTTLMAGGLTIDRVPTLIDNTRTIVQSMQTFTDSVHELRRRWRERGNNTIVDHTCESTEEIELEDLDDAEEEQTPVLSLTHSTTTNAANTEEVLFGEHTLETLSNLTNDELLALDTVNDNTGPQPGDIIVERIGRRNAWIITLTRVDENGVREIVYMRREDGERAVLSPDRIRYFNTIHVPSTSDLVIDNHTMREIEQLGISERIMFEASQMEYEFVRHRDEDLGISWTEVLDSNDSVVAIIDVEIAARSSIRADEISIQTPETTTKINSEGVHIKEGPLRTTGAESSHEAYIDEYNIVVANHELTPISTEWTIPGTTTNLAAIERMDWWERHRLMNEVANTGNVLNFIGSAPDNTEEEYTDVLYNNRVVGRIDQRHLNQVSITDNTITITNPDNSLTLTDHDIQWMRTNEQQQQQRQTLSGFISNLTSRIETLNNEITWLVDHPDSTSNVVVGRGSSVLVPVVDALLYIPRIINSAETLSLLEDVTGLDKIIEWCTSQGTDISLPMDTNEAISLNSCVEVCKAFRDTLKGPLALLSYKVKELEEHTPDDVTGSTEFDTIEGFPKYTATTDTVVLDTWHTNAIEYHSLKFKISDELKAILRTLQMQKLPTERTNIFRIILRKNLFHNIEGVIHNEFFVYVEGGKIYNPVITSAGSYSTFSNEVYDSEALTTAFNIDKRLNIDPYALFTNGDLSVIYLLNEDTLVSRQPVIKCDIIDAKNALKLHESNVYYLYRPSLIREVIIDTNKETYKQCWLLQFNFDEGYTIPPMQEFRFNEYCFGNKWLLTWDGTKWSGDNVQGHINGKIVNGLNKKAPVRSLMLTEGAYIRVKRTEMNKKILNKPDDYGTDNLLHYMIHGGKCKIETKLLLKSGVEEWGAKYQLGFDADVDTNNKAGGYDLLYVYCYINLGGENALDVKNVDEVYLDITLEGSTTANRFTFKPTGTTKEDSNRHLLWVDINGVNDSCEKLEYRYSAERVPNTKTDQGFSYGITEFNQSPRNVMLFLHQEYIDPIDEVNWDPTTTTPFEYITQQQFYEVYPNPNAATTLYTDYNITSSKIITADNITTMRSDLNLVTNNLDVMTYDVKDITDKVTLLNSEMAVQQQKTQYLEHEIDKINVKANVALVMGAVATGLSITSIGLQFKGQIGGFLKRMMSNRTNTTAFRKIRDAAELPLFDLRMRSISTDLTPILTWCETEYEELPDITFDDDFDDPETATLNAYATRELCNKFRDSLKPAFKMLCNRVSEVSEEVQSIDVTDQLKEYAKLTNLNEYIRKDELARDDKIDITATFVDGNIKFEAEDTISNGLLVYQLYVGNAQKQFRRRIYISILDGIVDEYMGVQEDTEAYDATTGEYIPMKGLAHSEEDRVAYMEVVNVEDKSITIPVDSTYKIVGIVVEYNSFTRHLQLTPNDLAYTCDIDAIEKKINSLAEQSHLNDAAMTSIADTYTTVDEVNEALSNYTLLSKLDEYALKSDIPPAVDVETLRQKNDLLSYTDTTCMKEATFEKAGNWYRLDLSYVEGTHFEIKYEENTYSFVFTIDQQTTQGSSDVYDHNIADGLMLRWLSKASGTSLLYLLDSDTIILKYELLSVTYPGPDELALKSEIEALKAENTALKMQIAALQVRYPWQEFELYADFSERVEFSGYQPITKSIHFMYKHAVPAVVILIAQSLQTTDYLMILENDAHAYIYFRYDHTTSTVHFNEWANQTISATGSSAFTIQLPNTIAFTVEDSTLIRPFKYIFRKPA